ncbi:MAG: hypothetical protein IT319_03450, partial [Anaerolineae bacterium]|nr:hypothetical protein [Anaerolineae bacterium]
MKFTREVNRLVIGLLAMFGVVTMAATYWAVIGPDTILKRADNPRRVEAAASILRGTLVDRDDRTLVESTLGENERVIRQYLYPAMYSALGYFSLRYGADGAESAFDGVLSGSSIARDTGTLLLDSLLHRATEGSDARLTLDLDVQERIAEAMDGQQGAVVVLSVPDGAVLAMLSLPTYDPNTLDANWDMLIAAPGNPFFNRVLQGRYQPGGALETPLMAAAFLVNHPIDANIDQATDPVVLQDLQLNCAVRLPSMALPLRDAYTFACPNAFKSLAIDLGSATVQATIDTFRLDKQPTLPGFVTDDANTTPTPVPTAADDDALARLALGQGALTVSPLNMALMAAAIV